MKKFVFILICQTILFGQGDPLFVPLNIQAAYEAGTRDASGIPGEKYWVNRADYILEATFDPEERTIDGKAQIHYFNNSPDTLSQVIIRLYQNIMQKGIGRDFNVDPRDLHDGVVVENLFINGEEINTQQKSKDVRWSGTNLIVFLPSKIAPQSKNTISLNWSLIIPRYSNIRMGTYQENGAFFVAYWYPQISVYDDIDGWDRYHYTGLQEFYLDPASFDVKIKVPNDFVVWGTGILQNPAHLLEEKYLKRYEQAWQSDTIVNIITAEDIEDMDDVIRDDERWNTWHYVAGSAPDFAFATSNFYLWDASRIIIAGKPVFVDAAYNKNSWDFPEVAEIARKSVDYFSHEMPAYPFPYPAITIFNGRGGMEFPMMVNDGSAKTRAGMVHVTSHEVAHTYFPFLTGTNERKYAWMDEGWASHLPFDFQMREAEPYNPVQRITNRYTKVAGTEMDIPMMVPTIVYSGDVARPSYRNAAYNRSGVAYKQLELLLGKELFTKILKAYIATWKEKHPIPYDFFHTFDRLSGQDLSWFWQPWFFDVGFPDLKLSNAKPTQNGYRITVRNVGSMPVPIRLHIVYEDEEKEIINYSAATWKDKRKLFEFNIETDKKIRTLQLGDYEIPDVNPDNNQLVF
jgi:hypothetical protein